MKRLIFTMVVLMTMVSSASAMSYKQARDQALFLTDKMAYELNLTDDQYNAAFEINLDYIMCVELYDDLFGQYWTRRNTELSYVLTQAQYHAYMLIEYFYRPISWVNKKFVFAIYNHYPKNRFYRSAPPAYQVYRGGNRYYNHSPYKGRTFTSDPAPTVKHHVGNPSPGGKLGSPSSNPRGTYPVDKKQAVKEGKERINNSNRRPASGSVATQRSTTQPSSRTTPAQPKSTGTQHQSTGNGGNRRR